MKVLQLIAVHDDAQMCFDRHVPIWKANNVDNIIVSPIGRPVKTDLPLFEIGENSHHGISNTLRWLELMKFLFSFKEFDAYVLQDYDAICLRREIPIPELFGATMQSNSDPGFKGKRYPHSPMVFSKSGLSLILDSTHRVPIVHDLHDAHFMDRWLGYLCEVCKIPITDHDALHWGYTRNTIEGPMIQEAVNNARNGWFMFHGVKTKECLQLIQAAYAESLLQTPSQSG